MKKGSAQIIVVTIIILALAGAAYYFFSNKKIQYVAPVIPRTTTPPAAPKQTTTYVGLVTSTFKDAVPLAYQFTYPVPDVSVTASSDGKNLSIAEHPANAGPVITHAVTISYEGTKGHTPQQYWDSVLKKGCDGCVKVSIPFPIKNATSSVAYEDKQKVIYITQSARDNAWLFIFELQKPIDTIESALSTFEIN